MSRRTSLFAVIATTIAAITMAVASTASAASKPNMTVSNGQYALSLDSNIVVPRDAPNPQFTTVITNLTGSVAICEVQLPEGNGSSGPITVAPGQQASATTGWGVPFPSTKQSTIDYQLWCNGALQLTASSKMTLTDHVG